VSAGNAMSTTADVVIQQQLKAISIDVQIRTLDLAGWLGLMNANNFDMVYTGFNPTLDPDVKLTSTWGTGGAANWARWSDPEYDRIVAQARVSTDTAAREKLYEQAEMITAMRGPAAFIFDQQNVDASSRHVKGYVQAPLLADWRGLADIWLDNAPRTG